MGSNRVLNNTMKASFALAIALCAIIAVVSADSDELVGRAMQYEEAHEEGADNSHMAVVKAALSDMRASAPAHLKFHVSRISKHAMLIRRAKAYGHNFSRSYEAIRAALASLMGQLNAGHKHDKDALAAAYRNSQAAIATTETNGKTKCVEYKNKACPTKRIEGEAKAKMDAAHTKMRNIGKGKICSSTGHGTWGSMDVDKSHPKFGTIVRNAWDKKRGEYVAAHTKYNNEKKLFDAAAKAHVEAMAAFTTAVKIEANNANTACRNAHTQYNNLVKEVMSNVKSRKHVYIASLVITCYIGDLKVAKSCADKKRKSDTSQWNISASPLAACVSKGALEERFGPLSWKASAKSCELKHWNERAHKETQTKEKNNKEINAKKEAAAKERVTKEVNAKEKAAKAKLERDTKKAKEEARKKKEASDKEKVKKEHGAKAAAKKKEHADKEKKNKEKFAKEKAREEKKDKAIEKDKKEKTAKEKSSKEKAAKAAAVAKEKDDKAKERRDKDNERSSKKKEQQSKEANTKATERNNKAAAAERKKKADEKEQKRRVAGTCTVKAYEHNNYRGRLEQHHSVCRSGRYDIRYGTHGRRRRFQASSFKLSSGCKQVQLWDEDACRYNYGDNDNIRHSVASVKYDLNDDICGISIWSKC